MRLPALVVVWVSLACAHQASDPKVEPLSVFKCTGTYPPRLVDREDSRTGGRPFNRSVEARSAGDALARLTAEAREDWRTSWRALNLNQDVPPFPGLSNAACVPASDS